MKKIRDPRNGRKWITMIAQKNMLGKDVTAWIGKTGEVSVYRSVDSPQQEAWIHGLTMDNYKEYMDY